MSAPTSSNTSTLGQVCDRCRRKKIRCHGDCDRCISCVAADVPCLRSARLQRNRKRKTFYENEASQERRSVPPSQAASGSLVTQALLLQATGSSHVQHDISAVSPGNDWKQPASTWSPHPRNQPDVTKSLVPEPVVGHMGRLVLNDQDIPMFAGSSTGVHFISQAEQKLQMLKIHSESLPSGVYSLYLNSVWNNLPIVPALHIAASFVAQFPLNAEQIIERTINQWTPLYPVVHKQSTIVAFRSLLNNPDKGNLCTVYQVLILLALGSVGKPCSCSRPHHHHFLCLSEHYYAMSTALASKILERPCLSALQGLILTQIYLQLSSRYPAASHLSGTAVRLAQTLGLHRHSARFKFGALEAELRRRAWWCTYALDAFSSTHHGMPRLIRDQDVDADLPTRIVIDDDYCRADSPSSSSSFPLPGESSPVDPAIAMFKLAAIVGDALEQLYTTTRRRGGLRKISRLQIDLDVWEQRCLAPLLLSSPSSSTFSSSAAAAAVIPTSSEAAADHATGGPPPPPSRTDISSSFSSSPFPAITFLRAALCNATVHIHRPALAFTTSHPQFTVSLRACGRASAALIDLLNNEQAAEEAAVVALLYPNGLHMLWQAGLTVLFARWNGVVGVGDDEGVVVRCVGLLRRLAGVSGGGEGEGEENVGRCADVLDLLRVKTFGGGRHHHRLQEGGGRGGKKRSAEGGKEVSAMVPEMGKRQRVGSPLEATAAGLSPQWNVWDWPMASALELANTLDAVPLDLNFEEGQSLW